MTILLVAYGNPLRQDDGAGLVLAEHIERRWLELGVSVRSIHSQQLTPELALDMAEPEVTAVVFVDASVAENPDEPPRPTLRPVSQAVDLAPAIGHHLSPELLLTYTTKLYDRTPAFWIITIPGVDFGVGDSFSAPVQNVLDDSESLVAEWLKRVAGA